MLIRFLDGGKSLGSSFAEFRSALDLSNDLADNVAARDAFEEQLASVYATIQPFSVRETKNSSGIELPEKRIENLPIELESSQQELYERFREELRAEVVRDGELVEDEADEVLKRLLRLVQVASNPSLVNEAYRAKPGKLAAARTPAR